MFTAYVIIFLPNFTFPGYARLNKYICASNENPCTRECIEATINLILITSPNCVREMLEDLGKKGFFHQAIIISAAARAFIRLQTKLTKGKSLRDQSFCSSHFFCFYGAKHLFAAGPKTL